MFTDVIPNFDGTPPLLNEFTDACEELIINYGNSNSDIQKNSLVELLTINSEVKHKKTF